MGCPAACGRRPAFLQGVTKLTLFIGVVGILMCILGLILFGGSWGLKAELKHLVDQSIFDEIVVDSFDAAGFDQWQNNYKKGHALLYEEFFLYNITNLEDIQNGAKQIKINLMGPYAYIAKKEKIDISFPDGGNKYQFIEWKRWEFLPELSCPGCSETDVVHNINPGYVGALAKTGGELELIVALTGPTLKALIFSFLWGPFTQDMIGLWRPPIINDAMSAIIAAYTGSNPTQYFLSTWANATQAPSNLWKGMLVSAPSGTASGIPLASAQALWNYSIPYSLLNTTLDSAKVWRRAYNNDTQAVATLQKAFTLSAPQLSSVINWLNASCDPLLVVPNFTKSFALSSLEDAAYLQWGEGVITAGVSVQQLYPEMNFASIPEINLWYKSTGDPFASLDVATSKELLAGQYGLFDALNLPEFIDAVSSGSLSEIQQKWGVSGAGVAMVVGYFADITAFWATPNLDNLIAQGNGLFANRTVRQWLWDMQDPLIELLSPADAQTAIVVNETSIEMARERHKPNLCWTGKDDIWKIGQYILFDNQTELVGLYEGPLPVDGTNSAGNFIPFLDIDTVLYNFDDSYLRKLVMLPIKYVDVKGVKAIRYEISNDTWAPDPFYYQHIQGFANLTGKTGAPMFVSNAHMYLCDDKYVSKIIGMKELQNVTFDTIIVDIEPNTGAVIHYAEALQVNLYLDPKNANWFNVYNFDISFDLFYPIMIGYEHSVLTDSDADTIKNDLYFGIKMESTLFWVSLGVGLGLFVVSVPTVGFFAWRFRRERRAVGYSLVRDPINDDDTSDESSRG